MDNNELKHYGVLGMKWGVRKARASANIALRRSAGAITEERRKAFHEDYLHKRDRADRLEEEYEIAREEQRRQSNNRKIAMAAIGVVAGVSIAAVAYHNRDKIKSAVTSIADKAKSKGTMRSQPDPNIPLLTGSSKKSSRWSSTYDRGKKYASDAIKKARNKAAYAWNNRNTGKEEWFFSDGFSKFTSESSSNTWAFANPRKALSGVSTALTVSKRRY